MTTTIYPGTMTTRTPDAELDLLFDAKLIPDSARSLLGEDLHVRPLAASDYEAGHLKVLQVLTATPDPGADAYRAMFKRMQTAQPAAYYVLTITEVTSGALLAVGSVFVEHKFIRNLGACGHIEDIAVDAKAQGRGLGKKLIQALTLLSESLGTYKVILDCSEENQGFYEKCGYSVKGIEMAKYK